MRIESGPTTERLVRTLLFFLLCAAFSAWFAYDGFVGYRAQNIREHLDQLAPEEREGAAGARIYETVRRQTREAAAEAVRKIGRARQRAALEELYGGPPSYENDHAWYYFGPDYRIVVEADAGRARKVVGQGAGKSRSDMRLQKGLGALLGLVSLFVLVLLVRILRTRVVLDDEGLHARGRGTIGWEAMKSLDDGRFRQKGRLDLIYADGQRERRFRLDEYHLAKFNDLVAALCDRKGFPDPIAREKAEKAARAESAEEARSNA